MYMEEEDDEVDSCVEDDDIYGDEVEDYSYAK
jgi:hypothetical protein